MSAQQLQNIDTIVVHCAATPPSLDIGADEIRKWHRDRGWDDIGYHFVIRRGGEVERGRHLTTTGAHVRGHNTNSVGVCLVGGISEEGNLAERNFTQNQFRKLEDVLRFLLVLFPGARVIGHRDLDPNKMCPCFSVKDFVLSIGEDLPFVFDSEDPRDAKRTL